MSYDPMWIGEFLRLRSASEADERESLKQNSVLEPCKQCGKGLKLTERWRAPRRPESLCADCYMQRQDAPDCCTAWTRSSTALGHLMRRGFQEHVLPEIAFHFCPWCGRARGSSESPNGPDQR